MDRNYSVALNLSRGLSAQLVLFGHSIGILGLFRWLQPPTFPYIQNIGVVVFFFVSGAVITYTIRSKKPTIEQFVFDRATRIFTALIPALLLAAAVDYFYQYELHYDGYDVSVKAFIGNLLMMASYPKWGYFGSVQDFSLMRVPPFGSLRPIWTIVVEWWLYIFFGVVFLSVKFDLTWKKLAIAALFVISLPVVFDHSFGGTGQGLALVWLFGAGYYLFVIERGLLLGRPWLNVCGLVFTILLIGFSRHIMAQSPHLYDLRYSIFVCMLIVFGAELLRDIDDRLVDLIEPVADFLAKYSYSLYLVHFTIIINLYALAEGASNASKLGYLALGIMLSNVIALGFWWAFESRYRTLRELIDPRPLQITATT